MNMISVTKRFHFCYGHFLPLHEGKCKRVHGHNAILDVEIGFSIEPYASSLPSHDGMVVDFGELKRNVEPFVDCLDHFLLNEVLPHLDPPTAENMVLWFVNQLRATYGDRLLRVRLYEQPDSYAEWRKGKEE